MRKPLKVVLFDLDGTLVKTGGSGRKAFNRAVHALHGVKDVCSMFSLQGRMDQQSFRIAHFKATGRRPSAKDVALIRETYVKYLPREVRRAVRAGLYREIRGISRLVKRLAKEKDVLLGLGTGNVKDAARIKLQPSGLLKYFTFGGYGTDGRARHHMLQKAVRRAEALAGRRARRDRVFVIGDTILDIRAARRAGYRVGAVTGGFGDPQELLRARPQVAAADFSSPRLWLRWILAKHPYKRLKIQH